MMQAGPHGLQVRFVTDLPSNGPAEPQGLMLYCPCLAGLGGGPVETLALLPIHDANGLLLAGLETAAGRLSGLFAGVLALDPFRRRGDILAALGRAGCTGLVNFPSIAAIDGEMRTSLEAFGYGLEAELDLLREARAQGFRIAAVVDGAAAGAQAVQAGAEALIAAARGGEALRLALEDLARGTPTRVLAIPEAIPT